MSNEELIQRGYLTSGKLRGEPFGDFEVLNIGSTTVRELKRAGVHVSVPTSVDFTFKYYSPPKNPLNAKPDRVFLHRKNAVPTAIAISEHKAANKLTSTESMISASEQAIYAAAALGCRVAITTNGVKYFYIDVTTSLERNEIIYFSEKRDLNPSVLWSLLQGDGGAIKDPKPLAESVWQIVWHATKAEPRESLLTFVELFLLKFLSDNISKKNLPDAYSFYNLLIDNSEFIERYGKTQLEYYISYIRPHIKKIFPDNVIVKDNHLPELFGLNTVVSKTSVINGFAFLRSSTDPISSFNRTFIDILKAFKDFGPLTAIDPEFKLRLYETFLKKSARQQKLGQFFTPRNLVQPIIRMAKLGDLDDGATILDPAAGVGGFVLEPLLLDYALPNNISFKGGQCKRRVRLIGVDVDPNTHILAKANMLIHLAEDLRNPRTSIEAINTAMAETFVLMNKNETLGSLEYPPIDSVDIIMTNPPYVTKGSRQYKDEISNLDGLRNGQDLVNYYEKSGLGLEGLFLRYISGALKPGGKAFVIVPMGLLTRTEKSLKSRILEECNIIASIALPRNTFFNTSQKTYILVLEKRYTEYDERPSVFCSLIRSIGESLDARRVPVPLDNDLEEISELFLIHRENDIIDHPLVKIVQADEFSAEDRWDVTRFWNDSELVELGLRENVIDRIHYIEEIDSQMSSIRGELKAARKEISKLKKVDSKVISISDQEYFNVRRGQRVTRNDADFNPGSIPVYSGRKSQHDPLGLVDEEWAIEKKIKVEENPIITVNANGYVGAVFVRREKCIIHDDVMIIEVLSSEIDLDYLATELRAAIANGNYEYEAKLYSRVKSLEVSIPVKNACFDIAQQRRIASAIKRFTNIVESISELGEWSKEARFI